MTSPGRSGIRWAIFGALCLVCVAAPVFYLRRAIQPVPEVAADGKSGGTQLSAEILASAGRVFYRHTGQDSNNYGRLMVADLSSQPTRFTATPIVCERVHFAAGRGICLTADRRVLTTYQALLVDSEFNVRKRLPLTGMPSRARVSPDGHFAAFTVFESGHSYSSGNFSTRTCVVDLEKCELRIDNIESFKVLKDGAPIDSADRNFWGVTFARESNRFFATLQTGGKIYLIEGDLARGEARVEREGIECPSLSPDNTRLAFKKRKGGRFEPVSWRIAVLNLATKSEQELAETRSVDDQVDWLDDQNVLYALPEALSGSSVLDTWTVPADGSGAPRLAMPKAYSLGVLRG